MAAPTNVAKFALGARRSPTTPASRSSCTTRRASAPAAREHFVGGGLGVGLSRNVRSCYRFLVDNYEPGDELYFFGFSRGAFTARSTVGFVRNAGILRPEQRGTASSRRTRSTATRGATHEPSGIAAELFRRRLLAPDTPIQFVGVWDTVGALGIPIDGFRPRFSPGAGAFHDTELSRYVRNAFHALAIDERREPFKPTLWTQQPERTTRCSSRSGSPGVHCDVGGGYRDPELSEIPLQWIADNARRCGLAFKPDHLVVDTADRESDARRAGRTVAPDPLGELHDSRTRFYRLRPPTTARSSARTAREWTAARWRPAPGHATTRIAATARAACPSGSRSAERSRRCAMADDRHPIALITRRGMPIGLPWP